MFSQNAEDSSLAIRWFYDVHLNHHARVQIDKLAEKSANEYKTEMFSELITRYKNAKLKENPESYHHFVFESKVRPMIVLDNALISDNNVQIYWVLRCTTQSKNKNGKARQNYTRLGKLQDQKDETYFENFPVRYPANLALANESMSLNPIQEKKVWDSITLPKLGMITNE